MWVMTSWGVLMPGLRPAGTVEPGDERTLQVRARRRGDLQTLRDRYMPDTLGPIIRLPQTDYEYRAYCTPDAWGDALADIGRDVDYVKFKETAETRFGDKILHDLYVRIWGVIFAQLSTSRHQHEYWSSVSPPRGKIKRGQTGDSLTSSQFYWSTQDLAVPELDESVGAGDDVEEALLRDGLYPDGDVVRRVSDNTIDHAFCEHAATRKARRSCVRQNR